MGRESSENKNCMNIKEDATVFKSSSTLRTMPLASLPHDLAQLPVLSESTIHDALHKRFEQGIIYTKVGEILIVVNPFEHFSRNRSDGLKRFLDGHGSGQSRPGMPHVWEIADRAFSTMLSTRRRQTVVLSGESGAGKTEAGKQVLAYLTDISQTRAASLISQAAGGSVAAEGAEGGSASESHLLSSHTILESFGNAKTIKNNNSSRVGKWIQVNFHSSGLIRNAMVRTYLLEKTRVVQTAPGERNFHIFYELLAYLKLPSNGALLARLGNPSTDVKSYAYLARSTAEVRTDTVDDLDSFRGLRAALEALGWTAAETEALWRVVLGVLHLGNLRFVASSVMTRTGAQPGSRVQNPAVRQQAAALLRVEETDLDRALLFHSLIVDQCDVDTLIAHSPQEAERTRDTLAQALYGGLFEHLLQRINSQWEEDAAAGVEETARRVPEERGGRPNRSGEDCSIAVVDMGGFEVLRRNGLEQLCVNLCEERLHAHFVDHCLTGCVEELRREAVPAPIVPSSSNAACLAALEKASTGLFALVDAELQRPGGGSEDALLHNLLSAHARPDGAVQQAPADAGRRAFALLHHAQPVVYHLEGVLDKSRDAVPPDLEDLIQYSEDALVRSMNSVCHSARPFAPAASGGRDGDAAASVGSRLCAQLPALMAQLRLSTPHFIKCIKSNQHSQARWLEPEFVMRQLRCSCVLGLARIAAEGWPHHMTHAEFIRRHRSLAKQAPGGEQRDTAESLQQALSRLQQQGVLQGGRWAVGVSRVYLQEDQMSALQLSLEALRDRAARKLQRQWKRNVQTRGRRRALYASHFARALADAAAASPPPNQNTSNSVSKQHMSGKGASCKLDRAWQQLKALSQKQDSSPEECLQVALRSTPQVCALLASASGKPHELSSHGQLAEALSEQVITVCRLLSAQMEIAEAAEAKDMAKEAFDRAAQAEAVATQAEARAAAAEEVAAQVRGSLAEAEARALLAERRADHAKGRMAQAEVRAARAEAAMEETLEEKGRPTQEHAAGALGLDDKHDQDEEQGIGIVIREDHFSLQSRPGHQRRATVPESVGCHRSPAKPGAPAVAGGTDDHSAAGKRPPQCGAPGALRADGPGMSPVRRMPLLGDGGEPEVLTAEILAKPAEAVAERGSGGDEESPTVGSDAESRERRRKGSPALSEARKGSPTLSEASNGTVSTHASQDAAATLLTIGGYQLNSRLLSSLERWQPSTSSMQPTSAAPHAQEGAAVVEAGGKMKRGPRERRASISMLEEQGALASPARMAAASSLHKAAQSGSVGVVKLMLEQGASVDSRDEENFTALHLARATAMRMCLSCSSKSAPTSTWRRTTDGLHCTSPRATATPHTTLLLLHSGAEVQRADRRGQTALHAACERGHAQLVPMLHEWGLSADALDLEGCTPLHCACRCAAPDTVEALLKLFPQMNVKSQAGVSPLCVAVTYGHIQAAQLLLDHGALVDASVHSAAARFAEKSPGEMAQQLVMMLAFSSEWYGEDGEEVGNEGEADNDLKGDGGRSQHTRRYRLGRQAREPIHPQLGKSSPSHDAAM
ncbi:hypothetical protein CYMTET_50644 [Cymbomonas tetramitiformis]|uniref:Myosin motor domain-containing protein n=1 Tax=Cymbomonas tetramitiformis TaxID=36881 RepID=A0AAE0BPC9_9CHLO|nr:hypothetical protein CYMTET_50644 [Cymbomonas tetramitiformis]